MEMLWKALAWAVKNLQLRLNLRRIFTSVFVPRIFGRSIIGIRLATVGFQPAGPYLAATSSTRYSFHVCIADRSPSDLFGRKQRLRTLLPPGRARMSQG